MTRRRKPPQPSGAEPGFAARIGVRFSSDVPADYQLRLMQRPHAPASVAVIARGREMAADFHGRNWRVLVGDVLARLADLPSESVQCCVSSPPYWNLRDYAIAGQIGLEATPEEFVATIVAVFREVRRVLKADGTLWVNLGDSYAAGPKNRTPAQATARSTLAGSTQCQESIMKQRNKVVSGLKPKDLVGIPWSVAFALRADGWWLRADHVWGKPNGMPESVTDRPARAHEYVFLLSKSQKYFYDHLAVRTAPKSSSITRLAQDVDRQAGSNRANGGRKTNGAMKAVGKSLPETQAKLGAIRDKQRGHSRRHAGFNDRWDQMDKTQQIEGGANLRSIWWIPTAQFDEDHFAVMPERVAEICIRASSKEGDTVLDPFSGSGTTGMVATELGRNYVGIELNPEYAAMSARRIESWKHRDMKKQPESLVGQKELFG